MRILAAISNYGGRNQGYLDRLLSEYRSMSFDVHAAVLSNIPIDKGPDVEVIVGMPSKNPFSLPFAHRQLFADRMEEYDLFVFSEDDTLISESSIRAFLEVTPLLGDDLIAGFLRSERASDGTVHVSTVHNRFYWDPTSVMSRGGETFACFTNMHSASFMATREQLRTAVDSGGFLVAPHEGQYEMLETAATDFYTQCGLRKMICISRIDDFLLPHLPNKYVGVMGLEHRFLGQQIEALQAVDRNELPARRLCNTVTRVRHCKWSKSNYEPPRADMIAMVPENAGSVLSLGCGWGASEEELMRRGCEVTAAPLDAVIGSCATARGVKTVCGSLEEVRMSLEGRRFGCLFISNLLHLIEDPAGLLESFGRLLDDGGAAVAGIPNFNGMHRRLRRLFRDKSVFRPGSFAESGLHAAGTSEFRSWFKKAGMRVDRTAYTVPDQWRKVAAIMLHVPDRVLGRDVVVRAIRQ
jgi:trans-aconitate methyltransferase